jgi:hypothetical protein
MTSRLGDLRAGAGRPSGSSAALHVCGAAQPACPGSAGGRRGRPNGAARGSERGGRRRGLRRPVPAHQHPGAVLVGQLGERVGEHADVVGGVVGRGPAGAQESGDRLAGAPGPVVEEGQQRMESERAPPGRGRAPPSPSAPARSWRPGRSPAARSARPAGAAARPAPGLRHALSATPPARCQHRRPAPRSAGTPSGRKRPDRTAVAAPAPPPDPPGSPLQARSRPPGPARPCPDHAAPAAPATAAAPPTAPCPAHSPRPSAAATTRPRKRSTTRCRRLLPVVSCARYCSPTECLSARSFCAVASSRIPSRAGTSVLLRAVSHRKISDQMKDRG